MLQRKHRACPGTCLLLPPEKAALRVLQTGPTAAAWTLEVLQFHRALSCPQQRSVPWRAATGSRISASTGRDGLHPSKQIHKCNWA